MPNLADLTDATAARADYNGKANTEAIIAAYTALGKDMDSQDMCKVLETYDEGGYTDWYVPAAGQLYEIYLNITDINAALTKIGGIIFEESLTQYWSSSEESADLVWGVFGFGDVEDYYKHATGFVRLVRDLGPKLITFIVKYTEEVSYQAEEGMTWEEWINSDYNTGGFDSPVGVLIYKDDDDWVAYDPDSSSCPESSDIIIPNYTYYLIN